jgi:hypothetical protein
MESGHVLAAVCIFILFSCNNRITTMIKSEVKHCRQPCKEKWMNSFLLELCLLYRQKGMQGFGGKA